ncbi:MAG TPA: PDZ domain-containing protein [Dongiaceae bacterium]|nr:PDZ domain-containing protein [Dongiaceae bacterium]
MTTKTILATCGAAALALALIAVPGHSQVSQEPVPTAPPAGEAPAAPPPPNMRVRVMHAPQAPELMHDVFALASDGGSWLGVETQEVSADKARELKLSAERGALVHKVLEDSPAAKAGLKDGDVVTEINGQRVEGTVQFRRMIREIPAGRAVQLTVWRDGRSQNISATLGKMDENRNIMWKSAAPQAFAFTMPDMPEMPDTPEIAPVPGLPGLEWDGGELLAARPRLGIDAEDVSGQLGTFFGAPDGEGILVRNVYSASAAEKAGVKAGDIITSLNGERIHGLSELRSKLVAVGAGKTVKLGVIRNKAGLTLDVLIPEVKAKAARKMEMRTKI